MRSKYTTQKRNRRPSELLGIMVGVETAAVWVLACLFYWWGML